MNHEDFNRKIQNINSKIKQKANGSEDNKQFVLKSGNVHKFLDQ